MNNIARSYEQKKKMNSRSNTIEIGGQQQKPAERESRKNLKRDKRGAATSLDYDHGADPNNLGLSIGNTQHSHILGSSGVQVSQTGTLLIGPGGRPKTSSGKHSNLHNGSTTHTSQLINQGQPNSHNNSRLSHYSGNNPNNGHLTGSSQSKKNALKNTGASTLNYPGHQRAGSTQDTYQTNVIPGIMKN